jgi:hypothetical protein
MTIDEEWSIEGVIVVPELRLVSQLEVPVLAVTNVEMELGEDKHESLENPTSPIVESFPVVKIRPTPSSDLKDFNFFLVDNKEYFERCMHLETRGVILFFLRRMLDEVTFDRWCLLN